MKSPSTDKSITIPGFKFSGISAGIKKTRKKDLALIFSEKTAVVSGVFTTNKIKSASVKLDIAHIRQERKGRAIIINSGNANTCTGPQGLKDAKEIAQLTAKALGINPHLVYVASTGLIGKPLPMQKIRDALPNLVKRLSPYSIRDAATAIMTTDSFPKIYMKKINIAKKTATIVGMAKGAGMICPHMATMLSFILTDIAIKPETLDHALRKAVNHSFNRLTIDNDTSTNDTVLIMANGMLKNRPLGKNSPYYKRFEHALCEVTYNLAKMIVKDAEGATKFIEVIVKGAKKESDAQKSARAIAGSLLVKTAMYGNSPNWGRIISAIGYSGAEIKEEKINVYINNIKLVNKGTGVGDIPKDLLSKDEITIVVELGLGNKEAKILTCDLSERYIKINASYMT
jgi:glutamate N-acetyltransferase/amino-acid N-acetyltransferase